MKRGKRIITESERQADLIKRQEAIIESFKGNLKMLSESSENDTYFETLSATLEYVRGAVEKMGYGLDEEGLNFQFGSGGVSYGQTKSANINLLKNGEEILSKGGKPLNRAVHISIYRMDSGRYELTMYKTF